VIGTAAMQVLRAILFNLLFFGWTVLYCVFALPLLMAPQRVQVLVGRSWNRSVVWLARAVVGLRHEVRGWDNLPSGPVVIAAKHQSAWETFAFPTILDNSIYVMKRELFRIPVFGWYLKNIGNIGVDRGAGPAAIKAIVNGARRALELGHQVILFPEGTRVAVGSRQPYHPGVAALYTMLSVPVVPAAINSGLFWGRRSFMKRPGTVVLEFLPAIEPGLERHAFMAELEARIEGATERLVNEARAGRGAEAA
jgi:1-acyl-sn-glycerol-3-phosphate acyltransferase